VGTKNGRKKVMGRCRLCSSGSAVRRENAVGVLSGGSTSHRPGPGALWPRARDSYCEDLFKCDWPWVSDFKIPEPSVLRERSEFVGRDEGKLLTSLSSLVRRLRSISPPLIRQVRGDCG